MIADKTYQICNAIAQYWLPPYASGFSPVPAKIGWDNTMSVHPTFQHRLPLAGANIFVVPDQVDRIYLPASTQRAKTRASVWIYLAQAPGQNHSQLMLAYLDAVADVLASNINPVGTYGCEAMFVEQLKLHGELRFKNWDDPTRRQSVGEIKLRLDWTAINQ